MEFFLDAVLFSLNITHIAHNMNINEIVNFSKCFLINFIEDLIKKAHCCAIKIICDYESKQGQPNHQFVLRRINEYGKSEHVKQADDKLMSGHC